MNVPGRGFEALERFVVVVEEDHLIVNMVAREQQPHGRREREAAVPIGRMVARMMQEYEAFKENPEFNPKREGIIRFDEQDDETKAKLIAEDPDYGEVICRCEKVTKAEILKAIHNPLGVHTMTGIKYRTRSMMGRCQGGYCQMRIEKMIEEELGVKDTDIRYARQNSWMFTGEVRKEEQ